MPGRTLTFARLDDVMPEVERLLAGYTRAGRWSLGQICNHLAGAITYTIEGFPGVAPWWIRQTLGRLRRRRIFRTGRMAEGVKLPERFLPGRGLDDRAEAEALRAALARFASAPGPFAEHPFFGRMSAGQWDHLHRIHCAHHLSFALPREDA